VGKLEGRTRLGKSRHKWVDNIKMDLREISWGGMQWICVAQGSGHLEGSCERIMYFLVPRNAEKFLSSCRTGGLSRRARLNGLSYET
jgi:hypothetical protein